ncbi:MAG TPA: multicopper oxidase domain-containing protein [Candidatus Acidoferrum sp.]|nr:multicopper oxidase domain-containing protein [Candidatus Acidoferrum sp.]
MERRDFLAMLAAPACAELAQRISWQTAPENPKADVTIRISPVELEIAPGKIIKTTGYNGSAPGPVLRLREGQPVTIEVLNDTKIPELVHWHGLFVPSEVDGSAEEGTPTVPPGGMRRYSFVPRPSGTRWYHSHISAGRDMKRATYTGQFGFLYIEPKDDPGGYDAEVFLALHGWDPHLSSQGDEGTLEVTYRAYSMNSHALGSGAPIRVKEGQKIIFRILNASATEQHRIALPGHKFKIVALDGNAVAVPRQVDAIEMGPAERVDAVVTMNRPGVWILGEVTDATRNAGLGVAVEYANRSEAPQWSPPENIPWDYTMFGRDAETPEPAGGVVPLVFRKKFAGHNWVDNWTINGKSFPKTDPIRVQANKRYRLRFDNQSDEAHPVHLHRHTFELTRFAGKATTGVRKDVVVVPAMKQVEVDFTADNPGATLFHCHQQLHMDYGFMTMLEYEG